MKINKTKLVMPLAAVALVLSAGGAFVAQAHADTTTTTPTTQTSSTARGGMGGMHTKPAAVGKVTAVDGNTITLDDTQSDTTYTVDATSATIMKELAASSTDPSDTKQAPTAPVTATVSDIAVGDTLMVQGTVSGTSIVATSINDGMPYGGRGGMRGAGGMGGQGVQGTVTAVNGTTLTITGKNGTTYTVDGSSATTQKVETISVSDVAVGDTVGINGTVSGDSVTATHIMDGMTAPQHAPATTSTTSS
jgi:riboflavin synthase alpha subunit